ncbi:MAG: (deoxy)nucleoside triphosphate pyrophosphohydrolase [Mailhella sp.]|nr:(deoxy)nucleoside triphosphate pyrophosphohydrolase [Mailhella sp.]
MTEVSAAIIFDIEGKMLICRRAPGGPCSEMWEFPGGKREKGENAEECLVRECREELGVELAVERLFMETQYAYPDREIAFSFFIARIDSGVIDLRVHSEFAWIRPEESDGYVFCPADTGILQEIRRCYGRIS